MLWSPAAWLAHVFNETDGPRRSIRPTPPTASSDCVRNCTHLLRTDTHTCCTPPRRSCSNLLSRISRSHTSGWSWRHLELQRGTIFSCLTAVCQKLLDHCLYLTYSLTMLVDLSAQGVVLAIIGAILQELQGLWLGLLSLSSGFVMEGVVALGICVGSTLVALQAFAWKRKREESFLHFPFGSTFGAKNISDITNDKTHFDLVSPNACLVVVLRKLPKYTSNSNVGRCCLLHNRKNNAKRNWFHPRFWGCHHLESLEHMTNFWCLPNLTKDARKTNEIRTWIWAIFALSTWIWRMEEVLMSKCVLVGTEKQNLFFFSRQAFPL